MTTDNFKHWIEWALIVCPIDRNFSVSKPGVLLLKYSNLEIWVWEGGSVSFMDSNNKDIIYQSKELDPYELSFSGTCGYINRSLIFDYHTKNRLESEKYKLKEKFELIF